jgi:nucleotide-binding universal stress UspA family protein
VTVVVAYDGSEESRTALLWALHETPATGRVLPVAVLGHEPSPLPVLSRLPGPPDEAERVALRIASRWNEDGRDLHDVADLRFERGHPAEVLARIAEDEDAEMIVLGHDRSRWASGLRASVAEDLLRLAPCPVIIV